MKKHFVQFVCDHCGKPVPQPHLDVPSLVVGVSIPARNPNSDGQKIYAPTIIRQTSEGRHFCGPSCLMLYVEAMTRDATVKSIEAFTKHPELKGNSLVEVPAPSRIMSVSIESTDEYDTSMPSFFVPF